LRKITKIPYYYIDPGMECRICRGWIRKTIPSTKLNFFLSLVRWIVSNKVIVTIQGLRKKQRISLMEKKWAREIFSGKCSGRRRFITNLQCAGIKNQKLKMEEGGKWENKWECSPRSLLPRPKMPHGGRRSLHFCELS
jgi:hypothetical protein